MSTIPPSLPCPRFPNIVPAIDGHLDGQVADCVELCRETPVDAHALCASLVPEGCPPQDKAAALAHRFRRLRASLPADVPLGVLVQSIMGHGWTPSSPAPFRRIVCADGREPYVFCPLDPAFRDFLRRQLSVLAALRPAFFLLDDDTRLRTGRDACFCPLHLAEFSRRTGREWPDRDSLRAALSADPALAAAWERLRLDTIAGLARDVRRAFDAVDPAIPGAFCFCEGDVGDALPLARILRAPGQAPVLRLNNGRYLHDGNRDLPLHLLRTERQRLSLPPGEPATILDEPDTCPQNRYSMSATDLHLHVSLGLLSGCGGAVLWLTRLHSWEPASGVAYRRMLSRNAGFYRELLTLAGGAEAGSRQACSIAWGGLRIPLARPAAGAGAAEPPPGGDWGSLLLGRMGIPYAYVRPDEAGQSALAALSAAFPEPLPDGDQGFAPFRTWLNETRKSAITAALARLASSEEDLPCWYAGDAELLLRAGRSADGRRILLLVSLSNDVLEEIPLRFPFGPPLALERLQGDGAWSPARFDSVRGLLAETLLPGNPAVFRVTDGAFYGAQ